MKIYYKQKNKIIKQIKYFKYNKEAFDYKKSVLFHFIYNKYSIINRNHIVNINSCCSTGDRICTRISIRPKRIIKI